MNITDALVYNRKQAVLETEGALSLLGPVMATGLVVSISQVITGSKAVSNRKFLNSAFKKIKWAVEVANRDRAEPTITLDGEETTVLDAVFTAVKNGVVSVVETVCKGLFSFIPMAIEMVAAPMFSVISWGILAALPLILSPEGLIAMGVLAAAGLGGYLYHRWKNKEFGNELELRSAPSTPGTSSVAESNLGSNAATGLRNNNPGNLVYASQPGAMPKTGTFAQFPTQAQGLYNMGRQLELFSSRGRNTVDSIVRKWSATDQDAYVAHVAKALGVGPNQALDLNDPKVVEALMRAMIQQENGSMPYSDQQIAEAVRQSLAFRNNGYADPSVATGSALITPVNGIVSSPFGHREFVTEGATTEHKGVDIAGAAGSSVVAAASGEVEVAKSVSGYGNMVQIKHQTLRTRYGHLQSIGVKQGDTVSQGQEIGKLGSTGVSTGAHLHFEVQPLTETEPVDPALYLTGLGKGKQVAQGTVGSVPALPTQTPELVARNSRLIELKHV